MAYTLYFSSENLINQTEYCSVFLFLFILFYFFTCSSDGLRFFYCLLLKGARKNAPQLVHAPFLCSTSVPWTTHQQTTDAQRRPLPLRTPVRSGRQASLSPQRQIVARSLAVFFTAAYQVLHLLAYKLTRKTQIVALHIFHLYCNITLQRIRDMLFKIWPFWLILHHLSGLFSQWMRKDVCCWKYGLCFHFLWGKLRKSFFISCEFCKTATKMLRCNDIWWSIVYVCSPCSFADIKVFYDNRGCRT